MRLTIVGPGRAGGSIGIAARAAGHDVVAVITGPSGSVPAQLADRVAVPRELADVAVDLTVLAVRDSDIAPVARRLSVLRPQTVATVHLSGFTSVEALRPEPGDLLLGAIGSFHPLQTLPDAETGARSLRGAHVAVTTTDGALESSLRQFAASMGLRPFSLTDAAKPAYHAAAACAANSVVEALALAEDLFRHAGVDPAVAEPLTRQVVTNVFELGAEAALTGPVARGDLATVLGHVDAAGGVSGGTAEQLRLLTAALALRAGQIPLANRLLEDA